jgi:mannose-6-phosphate isomerase-like protein (cupin superfamily)
MARVPRSLRLALLLAITALLAGLRARADSSAGAPAPPAHASRGEVLVLPKAQVDEAFAKGEPLVETRLYKVHASRRDAPGLGEVHLRDTDILYVLSGTATLTTGGELVSPRRLEPDELRGEGIAGGTQRRVGAGDVIVIPHGVPHWFERVDAPVVYYVVKATDAGALR